MIVTPNNLRAELVRKRISQSEVGRLLNCKSQLVSYTIRTIGKKRHIDGRVAQIEKWLIDFYNRAIRKAA